MTQTLTTQTTAAALALAIGAALAIAAAGVTVDRDRDEAFEIFRRIRGRYESAAYHLAARFYFTPAPWTGPRTPATPVMWPSLAGKIAES